MQIGKRNLTARHGRQVNDWWPNKTIWEVSLGDHHTYSDGYKEKSMIMYRLKRRIKSVRLQNDRANAIALEYRVVTTN